MMKKTLILIIASVLFLSLCNYFQEKGQKKPLKTIISEQNIQYVSELHKNKEVINIPNTNYNLLNETIQKQMKIYQDDFDQYLSNKEQKNQEYTLMINYKEYKHDNIISYVFFIESYTGGAHPDHRLWTVNYNIDQNEIITINDLLNNDKNFLKKLSIYARQKLMKDKRIDMDMMVNGTEPIIDNFQYFVYTDDGYIFYFPRYQVAPYVSGEISITVPYSL